MPELASVRAEWELLLGDEYPIVAPFIVKTGERVAAYPRLGRVGPPLDLVLESDRVVGVDPTNGVTVMLSHEEVLAYRIDLRGLCHRVCGALRCEPIGWWERHALSNVRRIGTLRTQSSVTCGVFLVVGEDGELVSTIIRLAGQESDPFVVLTPRPIEDPSLATVLSRRTALHMAMSESIVFGPTGTVRLMTAANARVRDFCLRVDEEASHRQSTPAVNPGRPADPAGDAVAEQVRRLKEMERNAITALHEKGVVGADASNPPGQKALAKLAGYTWDASFKAALSSLVKMNLLGNGRHLGRLGGYFLTDQGVRAAEILSKS